MEALGVNEIDIWREDMTPPPGTTASIPEWLLSELAGFLKRGEETNAEPFDEDQDRILSALNPGYLPSPIDDPVAFPPSVRRLILAEQVWWEGESEQGASSA